jgi:ribonuclease HI
MSDIAAIVTEASVSSSSAILPPVSPAPALSCRSPVEIWTDGSCRPNPGFGSWAAILRTSDCEEREVIGGDLFTTNNRCELMAAIDALEALTAPSAAVLHTDSEYLQLGMTVWLPRWRAKGWRTSKGRPVENRDLWIRLLAAAEPHEVSWQWVQGHAGDPMNERVDRLAAEARERVAHR